MKTMVVERKIPQLDHLKAPLEKSENRREVKYSKITRGIALICNLSQKHFDTNSAQNELWYTMLAEHFRPCLKQPLFRKGFLYIVWQIYYKDGETSTDKLMCKHSLYTFFRTRKIQASKWHHAWAFRFFKMSLALMYLGTGKEVSKYNLVNKSQRNEVVLKAALKNTQHHLGLLHLKRHIWSGSHFTEPNYTF